VFVLIKASPCGVGVSFRVETSLFERSSPSLGLWSLASLASLFSPTLGVAYDREKLSLSLISTCSSQVNLLRFGFPSSHGRG